MTTTQRILIFVVIHIVCIYWATASYEHIALEYTHIHTHIERIAHFVVFNLAQNMRCQWITTWCTHNWCELSYTDKECWMLWATHKLLFDINFFLVSNNFSVLSFKTWKFTIPACVFFSFIIFSRFYISVYRIQSMLMALRTYWCNLYDYIESFIFC